MPGSLSIRPSGGGGGKGKREGARERRGGDPPQRAWYSFPSFSPSPPLLSPVPLPFPLPRGPDTQARCPVTSLLQSFNVTHSYSSYSEDFAHELLSLWKSFLKAARSHVLTSTTSRERGCKNLVQAKSTSKPGQTRLWCDLVTLAFETLL